jgi:bisphosphoglycerate-dependent phosphoglycerate mutase
MKNHTSVLTGWADWRLAGTGQVQKRKYQLLLKASHYDPISEEM